MEYFNLHCPQENNWILLNNFIDIVSHSNRVLHNITEDKIPSLNDILHIHFTFLTQNVLIALLKTIDNLILIKNEVTIVQEQGNEDGIDDIDIDSKPVVKTINSNIYSLNEITDIIKYLSSKDMKKCGIKKLEIKKLEIKKSEIKNGYDCFQFINITNTNEYITKLQSLINSKECKNILIDSMDINLLNFSYNMSITDEILKNVKSEYINKIILRG